MIIRIPLKAILRVFAGGDKQLMYYKDDSGPGEVTTWAAELGALCMQQVEQQG